MKKAIAILLSLTMILGLAACGNSASQTEQPSTEDTSVESKADTNSAESRTAEFEPESEAAQPDDTEETEPAPDTDTESEGTKVLVAYFSATNTTEGVAEHIANGLNADIYEIVPEDPYTDADLNYNDNNSRTTIEMNDPNARPAISGSVENMEQYDIRTWSSMTSYSLAIPSGGERHRESSALSWKAMTFPARPLFLFALPVAAALVPVRPIWSVSPAELLGLMDGG